MRPDIKAFSNYRQMLVVCGSNDAQKQDSDMPAKRSEGYQKLPGLIIVRPGLAAENQPKQSKMADQETQMTGN